MNSMFDNETKSDNAEENLVFHYSHEHRIKNAPKEVQDYYNGNFELNKGIKVLFKNKSNRVILIALVIMTVFALIYSRIQSGRNRGSLGNYKLELTSFAFEEKIYTSLKITEDSKKKSVEKEPVMLSVNASFFDVNNQLAESRENTELLDQTEEKLQWLITDYDITSVEVKVSDGKETLQLEADVKR